MSIDVRSIVPEGGFLHGWLEFARPFQGADSFFLYSLLACAGAAVNGRLLVNPGSEPEVFTNVYVLLYGPSGARKGTPIRHATKLLGQGVPESPVLPNAFSMEKLIARLSEESAQKGKCGGLIVAHEFQRLVGGADYQVQNFGFLTEVWDVPPQWSRDTHAHDFEVLKQPYVNGLWSVTPEGMLKIEPSILDTGGLRRTLIVNEYGPKHRQTRLTPNTVLFNRLAAKFRERLGPGAFQPHAMKLSEAAEVAREQWAEKVVDPLMDKSSEREAHFVSCMEAHAIKIGALVALLEAGNSEKLEAGSLKIGQRLVEAIVPNMFQVYAALVPTPFARLKAIIVRTIRGNSGAMSEAELDRVISRSSGARPGEIIEAKNSLLIEGTLMRAGGFVKEK